jgi:hypothetical protein
MSLVRATKTNLTFNDTRLVSSTSHQHLRVFTVLNEGASTRTRGLVPSLLISIYLGSLVIRLAFGASPV